MAADYFAEIISCIITKDCGRLSDIIQNNPQILSDMESAPKYQFLLHAASQSDSKKCLKIILETGMYDNTINMQDIEGYTPLLHSINNHMKNTSAECFHLLLERGADPSIPNYTGTTPLHLSMMHQFNYPYGETLIKQYGDRININAQDKWGDTALHIISSLYSPQADKKKSIRLLIENGADPTIKNNDGMTFLDFLEDGKQEIITLIEEFNSLNVKEPDHIIC